MNCPKCNGIIEYEDEIPYCINCGGLESINKIDITSGFTFPKLLSDCKAMFSMTEEEYNNSTLPILNNFIFLFISVGTLMVFIYGLLQLK